MDKRPKRRSIPRIIIQRPSYSGFSEADGGVPSAPLSTPEPHTIDVVLSEGRYVTKRLPIKTRLDEERKITSELTPADRDRIIQEISSDMASLEPTVPGTENLTQKVSIPALPKVKRRMKVRGKVVRSPVLKLLLGRQLGGPTGKALKLASHGDALPVNPTATSTV